MLDRPRREVGACAGDECSAVGQAECARAVHRHATQGFFRREAEQGAGHAEHQQRRERGRGARVVIGGDGDRHAGRTQRGHRRQLRFAQEIERAGQQHGDAAGTRHGCDAGIAHMLEVLARKCAELGRQHGTARVAQLLGMQLHRQAQRTRELEYASRLRRREGDAFAKGIDGIDEALCMQARQPRAHRVDVVVGTAGVFRRQRVSREARGSDRERQRLAELARDSQAARFVLGAEPVARLDLERGHAFAHECKRSAAGRCEQRFVAGGTRGRDGRANTATGTRDVFVARAFEALLELGRALAGIDQVRVAVDEAGRDERTAEVDLGVDMRGCRQVGLGADPRDRLPFGQQRTAFDQPPAARTS